MRTLTSVLAVAVLATTAHAEPFAGKLHAALPAKNLVYSPASISIALAMTREGARGETAAEFDAVLGDIKPIKALDRSLRTLEEVAIANRLFSDATMPLEKPFLAITKDDYDAPLEVVDFRAHTNQARTRINNWVAERTHDKIKELLADGTVTGLTRLVLVNAIYFKAKWLSPFSAPSTKPAKFAVDDKTTKQVPMMHGEVEAKLGRYAGARVLDLPYRDSKLALMIVLPETSKLAAVEATYVKEGLAGFQRALSKQRGQIVVDLPKFKITSKLALHETLPKLGLALAFTEFADFTAMTKQRGVRISKVIHQAVIEVDEAGTEAAAATAVVINIDSPPSDKIAVDRAFAYFLHDEAGNVLFAGRVTDPTQH